MRHIISESDTIASAKGGSRLADDYYRAGQALARGEEIYGRIVEYLNEPPGFKTQ